MRRLEGDEGARRYRQVTPLGSEGCGAARDDRLGLEGGTLEGDGNGPGNGWVQEGNVQRGREWGGGLEAAGAVRPPYEGSISFSGRDQVSGLSGNARLNEHL